MHFSGSGILLDIEGTTSPIRFVYDQMFPFVRRELHSYLQTHWANTALAEACDLIAQDAGYASLQAWSEQVLSGDAGDSTQQMALVASEVARLMDADVKATGLKRLQGLIWKDGFESGELKAELFPDVAGCVRAWQQQGLDVRIYSSGSVQAQKLFFQHTIEGNLLPYFQAHYDTTTGGKKEAASYAVIAGDYQLSPDKILFVSDIVEELDAAKMSGMATALSVRPDNHPVTNPHQHPVIHSFTEIECV